MFKLRQDAFDARRNDIAKSLIYFWERMAMRANSLSQMYRLLTNCNNVSTSSLPRNNSDHKSLSIAFM